MDFNLYRPRGATFDPARMDAAANLYKQSELSQQRQSLELDATRNDAKDQEVIRQSAKAAVDPSTGQYSLDRHIQLLEQNGFPDLAQQYRQKSIGNMATAYKAFDAALPHANEGNWPQLREQLLKTGMPAQLVPEKFDGQWLRAQHQRLGMEVKKYGALKEQATAPGGVSLYGQENLDTGEIENLQDMSPPRPYAAGRGGGAGGGFAPSQFEREVNFVAETYGVDPRVAADIVRNDKRGGSRTQLLAQIANTLIGQYSSPEEATAAAQQIVTALYGQGAANPNTFPGRPRAGDTPRPGNQPRGAPIRPAQGVVPPPEALRGLRPGMVRRFANDSAWTVDENGNAVQVK